MKEIGRSVSLCILSLVLAISGSGFQSSAATLTGRVVDPNGAAIISAKIDATNIDTNVTSSTETNREGLFVITNLLPGRYRIFVRQQGFQTIVKPEVELHIQDVLSLNFTMQIGSISQSVTIEGGASLAQTETAAVGTLVNRRFVENIPLNGRSFQSLIALSPGVVRAPANLDDPGQFSVNGQRSDSNYFTIDGVSANIAVSTGISLNQGASGAAPGLGITGGFNTLVSVDALQEFKIQTSTFAPEFGRTPGAQVAIVTRAGANQFNGTLFEYFRNDALDANDWFANSRGLIKPPLRQNDFGGVLGGPVVKDRTFFFVSYEGLRLRQPLTGISVVPSLDARASASSQIKPFLNAFPRPTGPVNPVTKIAEFAASFSQPSTLDATSFRIDHVFNTKVTTFGRYNYAPSSTKQRGGTLSLNTIANTSLNTQTLTAGITFELTPHSSNDLRLNYSRNRGTSVSELDDFGGATPVPDSVLFPQFASGKDSQFSLSILSGASFASGFSASNLQRQVNLVDTLSLVTGPHHLKLGVDYRRLLPVFNPQKYAQAAIFLSVDQILSGRALVDIVQSFGGTRPMFNNLSLFAQDTWKITPRLALTYGLRWELNPPPTEKNGSNPVSITGLDNPATLALAPAGAPFYKTSWKDFAPRVGVAYQLSQRRGLETTIRGGVGVFYDLASGRIATSFANSFPNFLFKVLFSPAFPLDANAAAPPPTSLTPPFGTIFAVDPDLVTPRTYEWNVAIEQSLGPSQTFTLSYVGAAGRRLLRDEIFNNPNPTFTSVFATRGTATSDYHALQMQYQRRLFKSLQALASYTWSHSIDTGSSGSAFNVNTRTISADSERGPSNFDIRQSLSAAISYDIPTQGWGPVGRVILNSWSIDAIVSARSAPPVNVLSGGDPFGTNFRNLARPDLVSGVPLYIDDPSVAGGRRINRGAFNPDVIGRQGTLGRNVLRGFGTAQMDVSVRRQIPIADRVKLQLKAEFFNIFNHPNFGPPVSDLSNVAQFGQAVSMLGRTLGSGGANGGFNPLYQIGGPRSIQLALRLAF